MRHLNPELEKLEQRIAPSLIEIDIDAEADSIINKKVLPYIIQNKDYFM